ncbi:glycosyltransferase [Zoogloea sp.]|uniref:CgeB family protein n=1 Tax=Zoogloea sp. TaxID=49181 RepID=UPI0025D418FA|nr:glycosyltransferase [Zoogloea sp.]MCK6395842.1 glycosyltransferase [Zoogloea sp.]
MIEPSLSVLVVGKFYAEGFAVHISETLEVLGCKTSRFEPGFRSGRRKGRVWHRIDQIKGVLYSATDGIPAVRAHRMNDLWDVVGSGVFDVVIVCHDFLWPREVEELKRLSKAKVAMWFPDAMVNFHRGFFMNSSYDGLFFKDPFIRHALGDVLKSPVHYLPECFNRRRHWLPESDLGDLSEYECDVTTAGNQHSWRVACLKHLADYDVKLWGNPAPLWMMPGAVSSMHQGRGVYDHEKVRAFRGAKVVINNLHYGEVWGVNVRCFEVAGAGAFQMVDWRPGVEQLFEDGRELVTFRGMADLKEKLEYWLPRAEERKCIGEAALRRAHAEHTYEHRLSLLLNTLSGKESGFPMPRLAW